MKFSAQNFCLHNYPYYYPCICGGFDLKFVMQVYGAENFAGEVSKRDEVEIDSSSTSPWLVVKDYLCLLILCICSGWIWAINK